MRPPEDAVRLAVVALGRGLRAAGVATGADAEATLIRALGEIDVGSRDRFAAAARACLGVPPEARADFERIFARFWAGRPLGGGPPGAQHGEGDPRMPAPQHGGDSLPGFRAARRADTPIGGRPERAREALEIPAGSGDIGRGRREGPLAAYSPAETIRGARALRVEAAEVEALRRLARETRRAVPRRRSRRAAPSRRPGRLDVRDTVRASLRTDGEPLRPSFRAPSRRPRRLVVVCDVSGSMDRYSRALLTTLGAAVRAGTRAEALAFATRLTRLTGPLAGDDVERALARARGAVPDWSGGTRIGVALRELRAGHASLTRGAVVVIVSDGWDRGDPGALAAELALLRLRSRRLVWVNPRPSAVGGPLAVGMRAALPHLDHLVGGVGPGPAIDLARLLGAMGDRRPARPQRAGRVAAPAGGRVGEP